MKIKLSVDVHAETVDLLVEADQATRVGALARHLAAARDQSDPGSGYTIALAGPGGAELDPDSTLGESGIRSGSTVRLVEPQQRRGAAKSVPAAALLRVLAGPDQGREFALPVGTSIIGRDSSCDVRLNDPLVSREHAKIHVTDTVELVDLGSANGILVGDDTSDRAVVGPGDRVQMGDTMVAVTLMAAGYHTARGPTIAFNRSPVVDSGREWEPLQVAAPPETPRAQRFPIIPLFAPAILGVVIYLSTRSLTSLLFIAMSPIMMVGNVVEGRFANRRGYEAAVAQFRQDTADVIDEARARQVEELADRLRQHPSAGECIEGAKSLTPLLWGRWPDMPRFAELRLGLGRQESRVTLAFPQGNQSNRGLWNELRAALEPLATVDGVPVVARLGDGGALGVAGPRTQALDLARSLLVQVAALHSPVDMSIAGLSSSREASDWDWIKWLPHCLSTVSQLQAFPLASSQGNCAALLADLERIVSEREVSRPDGKGDRNSLQRVVVVVVDDDAPIERSRAVSLAARGSQVGVYVIWVATERRQLPAACRTFVEIFPGGGATSAGRVQTGETVEPLVHDTVGAEDAASFARSLAPVTDASAVDDEQSDLPTTVSFLAIAGKELARRPETVLERWAESRSVLTGPFATVSPARRPGTLRAIVGVTAAGPHILDLRTNGPHALVGGTTGSGKSELLQSWILGMAVANSPQRVTFLLVDYKGGSAFSECVKLPHTVGLVTDLSPHLVGRALTSLKAELRYREHILHRKQAKDLPELERVGDPEAPPSLVIVVDEFAALVNEVPEFVDGVVDVAQRGRSLGLHLILATQRPAGVIKDNLRANTNLRLALRMADAADSSDVLGSPVAADFDPSLPGRAISRTGPSKLLPFQSAYVGGWTSDAVPPPKIEVQTFGFAPARVWEPPVSEATSANDDLGPTDIARIVANLRRASERAEIPPPRQPWLPELASVYDLAKLPNPRRDDSLVFGVVDDPHNQRQPTVAFNPDRDGNLAVFGTGNSGKTVLLRTLAVAAGLTVRGGPCQVYGLDFGSRGLAPLEEMPHVGSIIAGSDHERLTRLLTLLRDIIDERAVRYGSVGAGTITSYRRLASAPDEQRILLLVDGIGAFRTAYEGTEHARWFEIFLGIAGDGRPVGVHVVVAADRAGAMPPKLTSLVQRRLVLRLAETNDYAFLGVDNDVLDVKSPPGRGLMLDSEIQVAVLGGRPDNLDQIRAISAFAVSMRNAGVTEAVPVGSLSESVELDKLAYEAFGMPVLGLSGATLAPIAFEPRGTFTIAGPSGSGRTTAMRTVARSLMRWNPSVKTFFFGGRRSALASLGWDRAALSPSDCAALASELTALAGSGEAPVPLIAVFIEGVAEFAGSPADLAMQQMVKTLVAEEHLVVSDGEATTLNGGQPLLVACRSSRVGIVLSPDSTDGMLFKAQFPRTRKVDFPPGRGLLVGRGGQPTLVQVAT